MKLMRKNFENYFWECFLKYTQREDLKDRSKRQPFSAFDSPNRNPKQVPNNLWKRLIRNHYIKHNNN